MTTRWPSGAYCDHNLTLLKGFETWRAQQASHHVVFPSRGRWADQLNPWWVRRARPEQKLNVAIPLWPATGTVSSTYTVQWTQFAKFLSAGDVVRLGWEMNSTSWPWRITTTNRTAWVAAWKRAYRAIKGVNPGILVELCLNEGPSQTVPNSTILSDLTGYFDVLGLDFYWWWGVTDTEASWSSRISRDGGLAWCLAQAQKRSVKLSVSEWGVAPVAEHGTGDTGFFPAHMTAWFAAHAADLHAECYFNDGQFAVYPTDRNPVAAAAYRAAYHS